jgi:VanZ family protein
LPNSPPNIRNRHRGRQAAAGWGLALIVAVTLFPFDFAFDEQVSIRDELLRGGAMRARGNDLIIGADAALGQGFKGSIAELRIHGARGLAASYSFGESRGTALRDDSGHRNHGELVGGPQWITEQGRGGLRFSEPGQHVRVPNSPSIDIGGRSMTVSMRVLLEDTESDGVIVAKPWRHAVMQPPFYQYGVEFGMPERSVDFYFSDTRGRLRGPFSVHPPMGVWTEIVFVYDGAVRGYVDGRELLATGLQQWELFDILGNLLLFAPLGFGLAALGQGKGMPRAIVIAVVVALGAALALGVEVLQCWLPSRQPSWIDIATNSASAALGAWLHFVIQK